MPVKRPEAVIKLVDLLTEAEAEAWLASQATVHTVPSFDWLPVIERDAELGPAGRDRPGITVQMPPGTLYFSDTWRIRRQVRLMGAGAGGWMSGTWLRVPNHKDAIVTEWLLHGRSDWSKLECFGVVTYGANATGNGITCKAPAVVENVCVQGFYNGIQMLGDATQVGVPGADPSNCNTFRIQSVRVDGCWGSGIFIDGPDANAGVIIGADCSDNKRYGIEDSSFLGNTVLGAHCDNNLLGAYNNGDLNAYTTNVGPYAEGNQPASYYSSPAMSVGGLAAFTGSGGRITMAGGEQAASTLRVRNGVGTPHAVSMRMGAGSTLPGEIASWWSELTGNVYRLRYGGPAGGATSSMAGLFYFQYQALDSGTVFYFVTQASPLYAGRGSPGPKAGFGPQVLLGSGLKVTGAAPGAPGAVTSWAAGDHVENNRPDLERWRGWIVTRGGTYGAQASPTTDPVWEKYGEIIREATAPPTTGAWKLGNTVRNSAPAPGGYKEWICVTAGTPGVWRGCGLIAS